MTLSAAIYRYVFYADFFKNLVRTKQYLVGMRYFLLLMTCRSHKNLSRALHILGRVWV